MLRPPAVARAALQLLPPPVARAALAAADRSLTPCQLPHVVLTRQSGITHQMNAQRARLRPAYYSLATAGGANKIRSSTWVLSDTNRLATVQPHSAVHEQTASLQPHPKGLPIMRTNLTVSSQLILNAAHDDKQTYMYMYK